MRSEWIIIIAVFVVIALFLFLLAIANQSYDRFYAKFQEINEIPANIDLSPLEYVDYLNKKHFQGKLQIVQISTLAGDAYSKGKVFLSTSSLNKGSIASYSVISHELGHAKQDQEGKKLKILFFLRKFGRIIGYLMFPFLIAGGILAIFGDSYFTLGIILACLGVLIFIIALITKMITISIEKDATKKGLEFLSEFFEGKKYKQCKKLLKAAGLTYWGDFLRTLFFWTAMTKKTDLF